MNQASMIPCEKSIVGISASPSENSSTARVLENLLSKMSSDNAVVDHIRLRDLSPSALVLGDTSEEAVHHALQLVEEAAAIVFATPIYKAAYSGLLKLFLDLMPQYGLAGKTVLALGTGGSLAHALALDYGLRPVLQSMGARHVIQSVLVPTVSIRLDGGRMSFDEDIEAALTEAIYHLQCSLVGITTDPLLGHPRPQRPAGLSTI
jgi:FMN reductase